jgi:hypothetical protein
MNQRKPRKLRLSRDTLVRLETTSLSAVHGAQRGGGPSNACPTANDCPSQNQGSCNFTREQSPCSVLLICNREP